MDAEGAAIDAVVSLHGPPDVIVERLSRRRMDPVTAQTYHLDAPPEDPARWWLRVERQTSVPLPELDRGLFTIRPFLLPLTSLTQAQRTTLGDAVASMSPEALAYKGISQIAPDLVAWCRRLS